MTTAENVPGFQAGMEDDLPWSTLRAIVLMRDEFTCQKCGQPATEVDHIWPKSKGGRSEIVNLQGLCGNCNRTKASTVDIWPMSLGQLQRAHDYLAALRDRTSEEIRWWGELSALFREHPECKKVADLIAAGHLTAEDA